MSKYKWILFDLDGTLFDYDKAETIAFERIFNDINLPYHPDYLTVYHKINSQLWKDLENGLTTPEQLKTERFKRLMESLTLQADSAQCSKLYLNHLASVSEMLEGVEDTLNQLADSVQMMIVTNGLSIVQHSRMNQSPISPLFQDIIISEEIGVSKPDPLFFDIAFERMGFPDKTDVLIVGDSLSSDMRGGFDYGIDTCWFNPKKTINSTEMNFTFEIVEIYQLLDIVS